MIFEICEPPLVCCCSAHDGMAKAEVKWSDSLLAPNGSTTSNSGRCSNCQPGDVPATDHRYRTET